MSHLLFVYGTLLQPSNEFTNQLTTHCTYLQAAKIKATLYDVGEYPGLVVNQTNNYVYGSLYQVDYETLKLIDDYEGYGDGQEQPNLYLRILTSIETATELTDAWVYSYNRTVADLPVIESGDYLKYLKQKKSPGL